MFPRRLTRGQPEQKDPQFITYRLMTQKVYYRLKGYSSDRTSPGRWFAMVEPLVGGPCWADSPVFQAAWVASFWAEGWQLGRDNAPGRGRWPSSSTR